jgi:hypothetical protein
MYSVKTCLPINLEDFPGPITVLQVINFKIYHDLF